MPLSPDPRSRGQEPRLPQSSYSPASRPPRAGRREGGVPDGLLLGLIGFLLGATVLVWTGTGLAGLLAHGGWPRSLHFTGTPVAMRELVTHPDDLAAAWPAVPAAQLPRPGLFWGILIGQFMVLIVLGAFAAGTLSRYRALRAARRAGRHGGTDPAGPAGRTRPAPEPDRVAEREPTPVPVPASPAVPVAPAAAVPATAAAGTAVEALPQAVEALPPAAAGATGGELPAGTGPQPAFGELTGSHVVFTGAGPGRAGKGERAVWPTVTEAAGAVVVTCADAATWQRTAAVRAKLGPVHVFDPEHLVDTPGRLRWAPHTGCEQPAVAAARARALLAPLRSHDVTADEAAVTMLRCWLHAAAVDGLPFRQLHRWAGGSGSAEALRVLRTARDASPGWSGELEATLHAHPDRRDTAQAAIQLALAGLNSLHIRDACSPGRAEGLDLESFVNERGTLYVVGSPREDPRTEAGAMPLLTALVSSVVEHGRRMAERSSPGRLDPPVTLVLDDAATLTPLPGLPALMGEGPAVGLPVLAVLRSEEQARHRWPAREAPALWQRATARTDF